MPPHLSQQYQHGVMRNRDVGITLAWINTCIVRW